MYCKRPGSSDITDWMIFDSEAKSGANIMKLRVKDERGVTFYQSQIYDKPFKERKAEFFAERDHS